MIHEPPRESFTMLAQTGCYTVLHSSRLFHEYFMGAALGDIAILYNKNQIGVFDGGEPMGDHKEGAALRQHCHCLLHQRFFQ